jgi:hypothetical protein
MAAALSRRGFAPVHDRGRVWVDVATMLAAGGEAITDIDTLRQQTGLLGVVASPATVWRTLDEATPAAVRRVEKVRSKVRRHVWHQLPGVPASKVAGMDLGETIVLDVDATLITAHSEKQQAAATFKHGFGFHPIGVWCDNTHELLAIMLRPGNARSNHADDHIDVLTRAIAQIPTAHRRRLLVRADGAGATHQLLDWLTPAAWAPGWGCSRRTITRIPSGQPDRSISPVTSATSACSRSSPCEVTAGVHARAGSRAIALITAAFLVGNPTEYSMCRPRTRAWAVSQSSS